MSFNPVQGFTKELGVEFTKLEQGDIEARMPLSEKMLQPHGFLHGGATLAFLETVASAGAEMSANLKEELPFGVEVFVRHRKPGRLSDGFILGTARFDREEPNKGAAGGIKQYWNVAAYNPAGDVLSEGYIMCKIVPRKVD